MSDRDALVPGSALEHTLSRQRREIAGLERRTSWRGALQNQFSARNAGNFTSVANPNIAGWQRSSATLAETLLLDPGRWVLVGEAVHSVGCDPRSPNIRRLGVIMDWVSGDISGTAIAESGEGDPTHHTANFYVSVNSQAAESITSESQIEVKLYVFAGVAPPYSSVDYNLKTSSILAFPG